MIEKLFILKNDTIKDALKKLDMAETKVLLVINKNKKLLGTLSDGDIRRHILHSGTLDDSLEKIYNKNPMKIPKKEYTEAAAKAIFYDKKISLIPIVDEKDYIVDFVTWDESLLGIRHSYYEKIDIPVIIMAGGKGSRLDPFTTIFPKPLIPVGEKPIIELIIDEFKKYGITSFFVSLNYKGEMIKSYFNSIEKDYNIKYLLEENFLGTAGSIKYAESEIKGTFIVSNCDIIVKADYADAYKFHKQNKGIITAISSIQHHTIPYGVIEFGKGGKVKCITEKPEYSFTINTGVYILEKECLKYIKKNKHIDMTTLISKLLADNKKVLTYPVNENDYIDIGQWEEYKKAAKKLNIFET
ncbi:sugar phosphate nucleotidyltransferase [Spirochaetota bacterium]